MSTPSKPVGPELVDTSDTSLLDIVDTVLSKGVLLRGDLVLGVGGIDLIYIHLTAVLCAADKLKMPDER